MSKRDKSAFHGFRSKVKPFGGLCFWTALAACAFPVLAIAQSTLKVSAAAWNGLGADERAHLQSRFVVEALDSASFGVIIDNQGVDRSTPGSTAGANIGGALAGASYIDRSFGRNNYSARGHLGAVILGGLLGSTLDSNAQAHYQFRYAVRLHNGNVVYQDAHSAEPFRHPVGVCVLMPAVTLLPEQHLCAQTTDSLRAAHALARPAFVAPAPAPMPAPALAPAATAAAPAASADGAVATIAPPPSSVTCRINNLPPVRTSLEKCQLVQGSITYD